MLNGDLVHEEAAYLASRVEKEAGPDRQAQVVRCIRDRAEPRTQAGRAAGLRQIHGSLDGFAACC